ncbi:MAG TPA: hypothetical protein VMW95_02665 [Desulfobacterales bacterium]|nr:hypothetical protein [Desulfobacterales bacterium]
MSIKHILLITAIYSLLITVNVSIFNIALADVRGGTLPDTASNCPPGSVCLENPLGNSEAARSPQILLGNIIRSILGVIGSLALVMFIYGGATWMLSGGNQLRVIRGKRILIWATVGLMVIFTSYVLVRFLINTVTGSET